MKREDRITTSNWDLYDTRHVVYKTKKLSAEELEAGYHWAYKEFYTWSNITRASLTHDSAKHTLKHFLYSGGWKKFEPLWNFVIKSKNLGAMLPLLESILSKVKSSGARSQEREARGQESEARSQEPEAGSQGSEVRSQESGARSQGSEAGSQNSGALQKSGGVTVASSFARRTETFSLK